MKKDSVNRTEKEMSSVKEMPSVKEAHLSASELALLQYLKKALYGTAADGVPEAAWEEMLDIAQKHAVLPLLYDCVPPEAEHVRDAARHTVTQSYRLLFMTRYLVRLLEAHQIPVAVLKGVSAAADYPVPELRKSGDVDLLLIGNATGAETGASTNAPAAGGAADTDVQRSGHVPVRAELVTVMTEAGFHLAKEQHANHHVAFIGPDGIEAELHYQMAEPFAYEQINASMERRGRTYAAHCVQREIMGIALPVLDRPYQAYQLLLHMFQHFVYAGFGMKLLCDWAVLWKEPWMEEEKKLFQEMVQECRLARFTSLITGVCVHFLGLSAECAAFLQPANLDEAELFLREVFDAEEFGASGQERMVMMKGAHIADYLHEFHHQMHLNYPEKGRWVVLWPALWLFTLLRFLRNNRQVRHVSTLSVLRQAGNRSRKLERLRIFDE